MIYTFVSLFLQQLSSTIAQDCQTTLRIGGDLQPITGNSRPRFLHLVLPPCQPVVNLAEPTAGRSWKITSLIPHPTLPPYSLPHSTHTTLSCILSSSPTPYTHLIHSLPHSTHTTLSCISDPPAPPPYTHLAHSLPHSTHTTLSCIPDPPAPPPYTHPTHLLLHSTHTPHSRFCLLHLFPLVPHDLPAVGYALFELHERCNSQLMFHFCQFLLLLL